MDLRIDDDEPPQSAARNPLMRENRYGFTLPHREEITPTIKFRASKLIFRTDVVKALPDPITPLPPHTIRLNISVSDHSQDSDQGKDADTASIPPEPSVSATIIERKWRCHVASLPSGRLEPLMMSICGRVNATLLAIA